MRRGSRRINLAYRDGCINKMTGFIDEIASLAGVRDRDALEYTMASVMFELTGARLLSIWSVAPRDGDIGVRCCVTLGSARCEHCEETSCALPGDNVKPLDSKPALKTCYETRRHFRAQSGFAAFIAMSFRSPTATASSASSKFCATRRCARTMSGWCSGCCASIAIISA